MDMKTTVAELEFSKGSQHSFDSARFSWFADLTQSASAFEIPEIAPAALLTVDYDIYVVVGQRRGARLRILAEC